MSVEATGWAWRVEGLRPVQRLLLVALADYADEAWSCYPGQTLLAERACCSERTVREQLAVLEEQGAFRRERRYADGLRTSDRYVLNRAYRQFSPVGAYRQIGATLPADSGDLTGNQLPGNHQNHQNHQEPPISPAGEGGVPALVAVEDVTGLEADVVSAGVVDLAFSAFWSCYPRRAGKRAAEAAFGRAVKRAGGTTPILEGARRLRDDPNLPEVQFVPHPATWLNQDRWEDEPLPPRVRGGFGGALAAAAEADAWFAAEEDEGPDALEAGGLR